MPKHWNTLRGSYHNILAEYDRASNANVATGWKWYVNMRAWCEVVAKRHDIYTERVISAFAVMSPTITVDQCKRAVIELLELGTTTLAWGQNVEKAKAIIDHGLYEVVCGRKVTAFEEAIDKPWGDSPPVIDRHAVAIYMGRGVNDIERQGLQRRKVHNRVSNAYRKAARERELPVHVMQAIVWESYREREVSV